MGRSTSITVVGLDILPNHTVYRAPASSIAPTRSVTRVTPPTQSPIRSRSVHASNTRSGGAATTVVSSYVPTVQAWTRSGADARRPGAGSTGCYQADAGASTTGTGEVDQFAP